jgi:hypothetical protein
MVYRPWRWLIALVAALLIMGGINAIGSVFGASEFFGIGSIGRAVVLIALTCLISAFVIPPPEKVDRREALRPLPRMSYGGVGVRPTQTVESRPADSRPAKDRPAQDESRARESAASMWSRARPSN